MLHRWIPALLVLTWLSWLACATLPDDVLAPPSSLPSPTTIGWRPAHSISLEPLPESCRGSSQLPECLQVAPERVVGLVSSDGASHACVLPATSFSRSEGSVEETARLPDQASIMGAADSLLESLGCMLIHNGWWSYEICHRAGVSQFHMQGDRRPVLPPRVKNTKGHYVPVNEDYFLLGSSIDPAHPASLLRGPDGSLSYSLRYRAGDYCPLAEGMRSVEVRFSCGPQLVGIIQEVLTCQYLITLSMPHMCSLEGFEQPQATPDVSDILCYSPSADPRQQHGARTPGFDEQLLIDLASRMTSQHATDQNRIEPNPGNLEKLAVDFLEKRLKKPSSMYR